jgi:hypothetical protein
MWSIRIAMSGAALVAAMANASAQTARTDPQAGPLPLLVINQGPIVDPSPVVADKPPQTSAKSKERGTATRSQPVPPRNVAQPQPAATRPLATSQGRAVTKQRTPGPAAFADPSNPTGIFPSAPPAALGLPGDAPSVAPPEQLGTTTVPTLAPQTSAPTMVTAPGPPTNNPQRTPTSRLLLVTLGGGVVGAAAVWWMVVLWRGRARLMPRSEDETEDETEAETEAEGLVRRDPVYTFDNPSDDPRPRAMESEESNQFRSHDWGAAYDNRRDDPASGHAERGHYSREWEKIGAPWRHDRASAYGDDRSRSRESVELDPRRDQNRNSVYDDRLAGSGELEGTEPFWSDSAHDAVGDALREIEEADQSKSRNAASADDGVGGARLRSTTPAEPDRLDQLGIAPPDVVETRQPSAGKLHFESPEREIMSLLGRASGKEAAQLASPNAAAAHGARDARLRAAMPAESNPFDQPGTRTLDVEGWEPNVGETVYDEQKIASLLGRLIGKSSRREEADQPRGRKATSAYDAVRDALGWKKVARQPSGRNATSIYDAIGDALTDEEEADQPSGYGAASAYDAARDVLTANEEVDRPNGHNAASAYDAVRDALTDNEEVDQPSGYGAPSAYDAVRDALTDKEEVDQPSGYGAASAYGAVRDALTANEEVDRPNGHNAASAYEAVRDSITEKEEADELLAAMRLTMPSVAI